MRVAPDLSALKSRFDRYFWANRSGEMALLQQLLSDHFSAFDRIAVIGGLVRDFAREGRTGFQSDINLCYRGPCGQRGGVGKDAQCHP